MAEASYHRTRGGLTLTHWWRPSATESSNDHVGANHALPQGGLAADATWGWNIGTNEAKWLNLTSVFNCATAYSGSIWCYPNKTAMDGHTYGGWVISNRSASVGTRDFQLIYSKSAGQWQVVAWNADGNSFTAGAGITDATWQLLGFSVGDGYVRIFIDGDQKAETAMTGVPNNQFAGTATIGEASWPTSANTTNYHGKLDEARYYAGVALTEAQHAAIHALGR